MSLRAAGLAVLLLACLTLYPMGMLLYGSLHSTPPGEAGSFNLAGYAGLFTGETARVLLNTIAISFLHTCAPGIRSGPWRARPRVGNLYRDSIAIDAPARGQMRQALSDYLDIVITREWPAQQAGDVDTHAGKGLAVPRRGQRHPRTVQGGAGEHQATGVAVCLPSAAG